MYLQSQAKPKRYVSKHQNATPKPGLGLLSLAQPQSYGHNHNLSSLNPDTAIQNSVQQTEHPYVLIDPSATSIVCLEKYPSIFKVD